MNKRYGWFLCMAVALAGLLLALVKPPGTAHAQQVVEESVVIMPGRIIAPPRLRHGVAMTKYDVDVSVRDNIATTTIEQHFKNNTGRTLEAQYLYPLPEDANFSSFTLTINGKPVEGQIMEKDKARQTYNNIVRKLIDPGLLEYVDRKTVRVSVAPIFADETKVIRLSYTQLLAADGGLYKYGYPFGFRQGERMPVENVTLSMDLKTTAALKTIYSPSHDPAVEREDDHRAGISLALDNSKPAGEKNFILYFSQDNKDISLASLDFKKSLSEDGFFLMTIKAPDAADTPSQPKDVILVIDTSGSMQGDKIRQAKSALGYIVNQLREEDRFNIVEFNTDVVTFKSGLLAADSRMKEEALDYVDNLTASGSTHIEGALKTAFALAEKSGSDRPAYVIFLTDGEPTVGITDTDGLVKVAEDANNNNARLFNFGVDYNIDTILLNRLAEGNHGTATYVEPDENLETALTGFYKKIASPVLTNAKIDFGRFQVNSVYPREIGDLFAGTETILIGRYDDGGSTDVVLSGEINGEPVKYAFPVNWQDEVSTTHRHLPRLWAGRRIGYLLDNIRQHGENDELKSEIIALSREYGIITPYTSFIALEDEMREGELRQQPVPMGSAGANSSGAFRDAAPMASLSASGGRSGVMMQKRLDRMKQQASAAELDNSALASANRVAIRRIDGKTFMKVNDLWKDTDYDAEKHKTVKTVTFGTDAYFDLLARKPELARYFSLGQSVLVVLDGVVYKVEPAKTS